MRPARKGPENVRLGGGHDKTLVASMRPARKGPENARGPDELRPRRAASMRPARKGPENGASTADVMLAGGWGFNEAGPQGAGKHCEQCHFDEFDCCFNEAGPQGAGKRR